MSAERGEWETNWRSGVRMTQRECRNDERLKPKRQPDTSLLANGALGRHGSLGLALVEEHKCLQSKYTFCIVDKRKKCPSKAPTSGLTEVLHPWHFFTGTIARRRRLSREANRTLVQNNLTNSTGDGLFVRRLLELSRCRAHCRILAGTNGRIEYYQRRNSALAMVCYCFFGLLFQIGTRQYPQYAIVTAENRPTKKVVVQEAGQTVVSPTGMVLSARMDCGVQINSAVWLVDATAFHPEHTTVLCEHFLWWRLA